MPNPFQFQCFCDVCGEEGVGTLSTAGAMWNPNRQVRHADPQRCADNLERKKIALDKREKELQDAK